MLTRIVLGLMLVWVSTMSQAYEFELVKEENNIRVFKAGLDDKDIYRLGIETEVDLSIDSMLKMNTDPQNWHTWMPKVTSAQFVEPGLKRYTVHVQYESPWPVKNRESVTEGLVSKDPNTGVVTLKFHTVESNVPASEDYTRIPYIDGFWTFTPVENGAVRVRYETAVDPGGSVPKWLSNIEAVDIPYQTMVKMLENIEPYRDVRIDWLHESLAIGDIRR